MQTKTNMFKSLNQKLDKLLLAQSSMKHVFVPKGHFQGQQGGYQQKQLGTPHGFVPQQNQAPQVQEPDILSMLQQVLQGQEAMQQLLQGQEGGYQQKQMGAPPGFVPQQQQAPQPQEPDMGALIQQLLQGEANGVMETNKKLADINSKLESLNTRMTIIENKGAASSSAQPTQLLYGCDAACLAESESSLAGVELQASIESASPKPRLVEATWARIPVQPVRSSHPIQHISPQKPTGKKKETLFVPPLYKPPLPFPGRFKKQLTEKYQALFDKEMSENELKMPLLDAFMLIPPYQKFLKEAVLQRTKEVHGMVVLSHECCAII